MASDRSRAGCDARKLLLGAARTMYAVRPCVQVRWFAVLLVVVGVAGASAGCGTATSPRPAGASAPAPTVTVAHPAPGPGNTDPPAKRSATSVLREVNVVCATVRAGGPRPLSRPYTEASLTRYSNAAAAPTQRTVVSLTRLERVGDREALTGLVSDYRRLRALYGSASAAGRNSRVVPSLGRAITAAESATTSAAFADGLPACGVAGR